MKCFTFDLNGKEINLRLRSEDATKIEATYKVKLLDYIQDYSVTTIANLFRFMLKGGSGKPVSQEEAFAFYDELVDSGYAIQTMIEDLIMPACEASGLLTASDLQMIKEKKEELKATQMTGSVQQ